MTNLRSLAIVVALVLSATAVTAVYAIPVRNIPDLTSITFWERTGGAGPTAFTFGIASTELTTRLSDPLGNGNSDFGGVPGKEFYDVYYSDADGGFNLDGEYLSISGAFTDQLPAGGGLNLAEIGLKFSADPTEFGNFVASFVALGDNAIPSSVGNAIDGDLYRTRFLGHRVVLCGLGFGLS